MAEETKGMKLQEMKEMFEIFAEKVPGLLNSLTDAIYGKDAAAKFGTAVADFYKTLKGSGMTDEQAFKLTEQYMSSLSLGKVLGSAIGGRRAGGHRRGREGEESEEDDD